MPIPGANTAGSRQTSAWHSRWTCSGATISRVTLPDDFKEFLLCLNARDVRYLVVGGHAVSFHGYPRFTHDVDVVVLPTEPNAKALVDALGDFGFTNVEIRPTDFLKDTTVVLGRSPDQIDIMTFIKGVNLTEAWHRRVPGVIDGVDVAFIAKQDLIANKLAVGRPEDLADIARLNDD
jgi:hypothetical protein